MILSSSNDASKRRHLAGKITIALASALLASAFVIPAVTGSMKRADSAPIPITEENFPDENFRQFLSEELDLDKDGMLDDLERGQEESSDPKYWAACQMLLDEKEIEDLTGIEYFPSLDTLTVNGNPLKALDVTKNTKLRILDCGNTSIRKLDLSNNKRLKELYCVCSDIQSLDLSKNKYLDELDCTDTYISELDFSKNTKLISLRCSNNPIKSLDLSKCENLEYLEAEHTKLTELDLTANKSLLHLYVSSNKDLSALNVQGLTSLENLICSECAIEELDLSGLTSLKDLRCDSNDMKALNLEGCTALETAEFMYNEIVYVDLSSNADLVDAYLNGDHYTFEDGVTVYGKFDLSDDKEDVDKLDCGFMCDDTTNILTKAPVTYTMPDVIGQYYKDAADFLKEDLKKAGYEKVNVSVGWAYVYSVPELCVAASTPKPGESWKVVTKEISVIIMVAEKYPTPTPKATYEMPDVIGQNYEEAKAFLEEDLTDAGFKEVTVQVGWAFVDNAEPLTVVSQDPEAGEELSVVDSITVTIMVAEKRQDPPTPGPTTPVPPTPGPTTPVPPTPGPTTPVPPTPGPTTPVPPTPGPTTPVPPTPGPTTPEPPTPTPGEEPSIADFVERLYTIALNRPSEEKGKNFWIDEITSGRRTGGDCGREFLFSPEFENRKLSIEDFVETLYATFFDRPSEAAGKEFWVGQLKNNTMSRYDVINGFIDSKEWCNVCATYGVKSGAPTAKAEIASKNAINFATRLYTCCLGRDPEEKGLDYWALALTNLEQTGCSAAKEFFKSQEFANLNLKTDEYITRLYTTFMDREPEASEVAYWAGEIAAGTQTRDSVLAFFGQSEEFTNVCAKYGIDRGTI